MPRLLHSNSAYLRVMQMSSVRVFVFVEGQEYDPFFYGSLCATILFPGYPVEVRTARELPAASGGKQSILVFFDFLRQRRALISSLNGKKTAAIFYVDKDVDDILHIQKRSPHLVYTEYYDVQNYIFEYGDIVCGAASAASIDPSMLASTHADSSSWCASASRFWIDWVALCLLILKEGISDQANYGVLSQVQTQPCGPTDQTLLAQFVNRIQLKSGIPDAQFRMKLENVSKRVELYFRRGDHHRIFKGKWFAPILADEIHQLMGGRPYRNSRLTQRLPASIASTLDFSQTWARHFTQPLREIIKEL